MLRRLADLADGLRGGGCAYAGEAVGEHLLLSVLGTQPVDLLKKVR
jgi:hypothetical protein